MLEEIVFICWVSSMGTGRADSASALQSFGNRCHALFAGPKKGAGSMWGRYCLSGVILFAMIGLARVGPAQQSPPPAEKGSGNATTLPPETALLLRTATAAYQKMQSYQHTAEYLAKGPQGGPQITAFTLALERPNKFCYRSDDADATAAVCDGKMFINFKNDEAGMTYTRTTAPASYKQIDIVGDVTFTPIGTYVVALMLQGDAMADPDVRDFILQAGEPKHVTEDTARYDTLTGKFGAKQDAMTLFF